MRYEVMRQHDSSDCGPACLAMIAAHYGKAQSLAQLRERAHTDRQGTNLAGLIRAAEAIGFQARGVRADEAALPNLPLPAIAHWVEDGRHHFVVLFRRTARRLTVGDPAKGLRKMTPAEFRQRWTGVLLLLTPTADLKSIGAGSTLRLAALLLPHGRLFLDALLAAVLMTLLALSSSFFIQALVDFVFTTGGETTLNWLVLGLLLALAARSAFLLLRAFLLAHLGQRIDAEIVLGYHHHLLGLPLAFFRSRQTGEVLARFSDAAKIRAAVAGSGLSIVVDGATVAVTAAIMLWLHPGLALAAFGLSPVLAGVVLLLTAPMKRAQRTAMERSAQFEAHVVEAVESVESLKTLRAEGRMRGRGEARFAETIAAAFRAQMFAAGAGAATTLLGSLSGLLLLWYGGHAVLDDQLTVGQLMALYTMLGAALGPIERLAGANEAIQEALIAADRVGEVLQLAREEDPAPGRGIDRPLRGEIEFRQVAFRYGRRAPVFENLTLRIPAGECCAIAGGSGSGKSTLARLVPRLLEPDAGQVLLDGVDARDYTLDCLRRQVAYVSQEPGLLGVSIAENIRLGCPEASPADVRRAAEEAGASAFIERLPLRYETVVGERGLTLSGGERQRLALARALVQDPPVLILDEPANHLDAASIAVLHGVIERRRRDRRTTLLISHDPLPSDRVFHLGLAYALAQ